MSHRVQQCYSTVGLDIHFLESKQLQMHDKRIFEDLFQSEYSQGWANILNAKPERGKLVFNPDLLLSDIIAPVLK